MNEASGDSPPAGEAPPAADPDRADAGEPDDPDELDETIEGPDLSVEEVVSREPTLSPGRSIDSTRALLAGGFFVVFALTVAAAILVAAFAKQQHVSDVDSVLRTLIPAETALLGSAVGFYFGTRH
jgi:hypothetical protein